MSEYNMIEKNITSKPVEGSTFAVIELRAKHPEIAKAFEQYTEEQYELFARKMLDYGKDNISVGTQLETPEEVRLSLTGLYFRMQDKVSRIKQLVALGNAAKVADESVFDTFRDLSIYGLIAQIVTAKRWK